MLCHQIKISVKMDELKVVFCTECPDNHIDSFTNGDLFLKYSIHADESMITTLIPSHGFEIAFPVNFSL